MFTGIVTDLGYILHVEKRQGGVSLCVKTPFQDLTLGESVAVNGTCLTVESFDATSKNPNFFISPESLRLTNLNELEEGTAVNLERALPQQGLGSRLSGHIVQGHVDGVAEILSITSATGASFDGAKNVVVKIPKSHLNHMVTKGSICLDGVSLTINSIADDTITLTIIPHTWEHTTFHRFSAGKKLNFETDVIAKYVERMLLPWRENAQHT